MAPDPPSWLGLVLAGPSLHAIVSDSLQSELSEIRSSNSCQQKEAKKFVSAGHSVPLLALGQGASLPAKILLFGNDKKRELADNAVAKLTKRRG